MSREYDAIDSLLRGMIEAGVAAFFVAPGARNAPVLSRLGEGFPLPVYRHFDERGLAYLALGFAQRVEKPVVICCTSGTAVANLLPAVCEAWESRVALWVLSCDRPPELKDSGANQTVHQESFLTSQVGQFRQLPLPRAIKQKEIKAWLEADALLLRPPQQMPLHWNLPLEEPLPLSYSGENTFSNTKPMEIAASHSTNNKNHVFKADLILLGQCRSSVFKDTINKALREQVLPVFADVLFGCEPGLKRFQREGFFQHLLASGLQFKRILWLGGRFLDKHALSFLQNQSEASIFRLDSVDQMLSPKSLKLEQHLFQSGDRLKLQLEALDFTLPLAKVEKARHALCYLFELLSDLSMEHRLFVANSLPVRYFHLLDSAVCLHSNRGASGIDGQIATAIGSFLHAQETKRPVILLGDLSFLHDLNSLFALEHLPVERRPHVVLIDNGGGNIFSQLPIHQPDAKAYQKYIHYEHSHLQSTLLQAFPLKLISCSEFSHVDLLMNEDQACLFHWKINPLDEQELWKSLKLQRRNAFV